MLGEKERNETPQSRRQKRELKLKTKDARDGHPSIRDV